MQFPVNIQLLNCVIPTSSLTCLMMDAENVRHLKSLRAFEKSDILHIFAVQKHAQNGNNATSVGWAKQLPKPLFFYCLYGMLGKEMMLWVKQLSSQMSHRGSVLHLVCLQIEKYKKN